MALVDMFPQWAFGQSPVQPGPTSLAPSSPVGMLNTQPAQPPTQEGSAPLGMLAEPEPNGFMEGLGAVADSGMLQDLSFGLLNGKNWGQAATMAGNRSLEMAPKRREEAKAEAVRNQTTEALQNMGQGYGDLVDAVKTGAMTPNDAYLEAMRRKQPIEINGQMVDPLSGNVLGDYRTPDTSGASGANAPSNVQEWQYYSQLSPEEKSQYLNMKRSNSPLNIGTGFVTQDQANPGNLLGAPIAINNEEKAFDTATGTGLGAANAENIVTYESVSSKLPGLRGVIGDLTNLADTATYTQSGQAMDSVKRELGLPVGQGAIDRTSYISIVDNQVLPLLRDTFGAAFTVSEGEALRATLGDANKSPAEKKAVLDAFIAQKERDVVGMKSRIPGGAAAVGGGVDDILSGYGL